MSVIRLSNSGIPGFSNLKAVVLRKSFPVTPTLVATMTPIVLMLSVLSHSLSSLILAP